MKKKKKIEFTYAGFLKKQGKIFRRQIIFNQKISKIDSLEIS